MKKTLITGISDPYEEPTDEEIVIDSCGRSPEVLVKEIFMKIKTISHFFKTNQVLSSYAFVYNCKFNDELNMDR